MSKKEIIVILSIVLTLVLGVSSCFTVNQSPTPEQSVLETSEPPEYHTLTFTLEGGEEWSFPIYLRNNETLHLLWRVEGYEYPVWFHILTPSGVGLGFYDNEGEFADNTLMEGFTRGMIEGITQFSPSDYGWGEGYYIMWANANSYEPIAMRVEYWIEG